MKKFLFASAIAFIVLSADLSAQCTMIPVNLEIRTSSSDLIVEAEIVKQEFFREFKGGNIYTANYLKVYKLFKGNIKDDEIVLISPGGRIDDSQEEVKPSIYVKEGLSGLFFLYESEIIGDESLNNYKPFSGPQACIYYDKSGTARDVFNSYVSVENEVYGLVENLVGYSKKEINKFNYFSSYNDKSATQVTGISPDTVIAGVKFELFITGKDFGETQGNGRVEFTNASTGPAFVQPAASQYRSWTDTLLVVRVPHTAGTGIIRVTKNGTGIFSSPYIPFAHLNTFNFSKVLEPYHRDDNGNGGFTWTMSTQFDNNAGAKSSFLRAIATWSDGTCINWENGPPSSNNQDLEDGINILRFANSGELPNGVLGITRNRWKVCNVSSSYTSEIDLSYSPDINWNFLITNPPNNTWDFESVILHELGHAHQLGHVKDRQDLMFATIGPGQLNRTLIDNNIEGGLYIMKTSVSPFPCGPASMIGISGCNIPVGIEQNEDANKLRVYPNPFSNILIIENNSDKQYNIGIFNILGEQVKELKVPGNTQKFTWSVQFGLPEGLYILKNLNNGALISKVILSR